MIGLDFKTL